MKETIAKGENKLKDIDFTKIDEAEKILNKYKKVVPEGIEPSTVALLAQRSNQLSYATSLII